jgi:hypothetical protein
MTGPHTGQYRKDGRAPVLTAEHRLTAEPRAASVTGEILDDVHASTPPHINLRQRIIQCNGLACHHVMLTRALFVFQMA